MLSVAPTVVTVWRYHRLMCCTASVLCCGVVWCRTLLCRSGTSSGSCMTAVLCCSLTCAVLCHAVPCRTAVLQDPPVSERHITWCLYDSCAVLYVDMWYAVLSFWCSQDPPVSERHITWHLYDSDERAAAYIAGPAPCRWGLNFFSRMVGWMDGYLALRGGRDCCV
jgi:hypothetical protein